MELYDQFRRQPSPASQRGFSPIDLIVTLAIIAIMITAVVPAALTSLRTYQRNGAARQVLAEIRTAQSLAVTRHSVFGFHWGADPSLSGPPNEYRIVRDTTGACGFPTAGAAEDGTDVVRAWTDLSASYPGVQVLSIRDKNDQLVGGVMFDSRGASVNTCTGVSFPLRVTVADASGESRVIEIRSAGGTRLL